MSATTQPSSKRRGIIFTEVALFKALHRHIRAHNEIVFPLLFALIEEDSALLFAAHICRHGDADPTPQQQRANNTPYFNHTITRLQSALSEKVSDAATNLTSQIG